MADVTIVDYGSSNLLSVVRAFDRCGADVDIAVDAETVDAASRLVVPGVGAFAKSMAGIHAADFAPSLIDFARSGKPFLGICVGMQVMFSSSEEFGVTEGLGIIPGHVKAIPSETPLGGTHKIPHIGWVPIEATAADPLLDGIDRDECFYFIHSFTGWPDNSAHRLADTDYDGCQIAAIVKAGNAYGCQFHPEKSGPVGLRLIENFLGLA